VGCDDRFIRFNGDVGEGASAALPIWGYFFQKAMADKTLALDRNSKFSKPEVMSNDEIFDYMNTINADNSAPAEGENVGNGTSDDYILPDVVPEEVGAESEVPTEKTKPGAPTNEKTKVDPTSPAAIPGTEIKPETKEEGRGGIFGLFKKKKKKEEETTENPKAVMPKESKQ
jgi:penicillin-binding protein 1A